MVRLSHDVLHLEQRHKSLGLLVRAIGAPPESLTGVDAPPVAELGPHVRLHPIPLACDGGAGGVGVGVHSLLTVPREVRLKGARYREPFGVI